MYRRLCSVSCAPKRPGCRINLLFGLHIGLQSVTVNGHVCYHNNKLSFVAAAGLPTQLLYSKAFEPTQCLRV